MCGFCGYVNYNENITDDKIVKKMNDKIYKRGPNEQNVFIDKNTAFAHSRLSIIDVKYGSQPMQMEAKNNIYTIIYNGELYNTSEIRTDLLNKGYHFQNSSDTEVILASFIEYGKKCVNFLNGIFSFVIYDKKENLLFLARDRLGIKPLFYTQIDDTFIFGSEIKAILEHPKVVPIVNKESILELIGLGPAHTPGKTFFKNILELKPGFMATLNQNGFVIEKYWDLETKECHDTETEAIEKIHFLVTDSCKRQLVSDVGICSMLSGGIDSSILTKIANDHMDHLTTFSIDYLNNDTDFVSNSYQMTKDSDFVKIMRDYLKTNHKTVKIDNTELFELLDDSLIARDMPGMADIDSSMLAFCKEISKEYKVCLSGECSDEIFGGYPWFYRKHLVEHNGFPWALSENLRTDLIKKDLFEKGDIQEYIDHSIKNTLSHVKHLESSDSYENRFKDINYLTIKWFMNTLVERTDRMSMQTSLEVRVPFADHRIFEYVYNLPAQMKLGLNHSNEPVEKYLLRKAFEGEIPNEILYRKKSPFPKTYSPTYLNLVETRLKNILANKNSRIHEILNIDYVSTLIHTHGSNLKENLFGQLMTYPQTLAYIIQINTWLEKYQPKLEI
ncbi:MAG: asparagine synthase (glutamine-hydrolyzing) [Clostridia bacterium]|nr:asparagine synthase (glutamine-hydrolyzing) [Clostridia bacterium]